MEGTHRNVKRVFDLGKSSSILQEAHAMHVSKTVEELRNVWPHLKGLCLNRAEEAVIKLYWNWVSLHAISLLGRSFLIHVEIIPRRENPVTGKYYPLWNHPFGLLCSLPFLSGCVPDRHVAGGLRSMLALGDLPSYLESSASTPEPWHGGNCQCYFSPRPVWRARLPIVSDCQLTPSQ